MDAKASRERQLQQQLHHYKQIGATIEDEGFIEKKRNKIVHSSEVHNIIMPLREKEVYNEANHSCGPHKSDI